MAISFKRSVGTWVAMATETLQRIHIVGCGPRSGTTLLTEVMIACFEIDSYTLHEDRVFTRPPPGAKIFLTKAPQDIVVVEPLLKIISNLHVIYMLRDPRDMIVSKHGSEPERYWSGLKYWKTYTPYARRLSGHRRFVVVRYENLVSEPDAVQTFLMQRMPFLRPRAPFSCYHELTQPSDPSMKALRGVRPISTSSVGNWRKHLPRVAGQLQLHGSISPDLIECGYEPDDEWEGLLVGVETDTAPSHRSDFHSKRWLRRRKWEKYFKAIPLMLAHNRPLFRVPRFLGCAKD